MNRKAFTLIELLIVVAIIAILAAIAVPNFIEAQVRSKVSRVKADMRSIATAAGAYQVEHNTFPPNRYGTATTSPYGLCGLTTPISFITAIPRDVFQSHRKMIGSGAGAVGMFLHTFGASVALRNPDGTGNRCAGQAGSNYNPWPKDMYLMASPGPDRVIDSGSVSNFPNCYGSTRNVWVYDSSNGSTSRGDIYRWFAPSRYDVIFEVGYDPTNGIDPTDGQYAIWKSFGVQ